MFTEQKIHSFFGNRFLDIKSILSDNAIKEAGVFDPSKVKLLIQKAEKSQSFSELDNMAVAAIISTQFLYDHFINYKKVNVPSNYSFNKLIDNRNKI